VKGEEILKEEKNHVRATVLRGGVISVEVFTSLKEK